MKNGHGPATVIGNESQECHCPERDGKARRVGSKAVSQDTRLRYLRSFEGEEYFFMTSFLRWNEVFLFSGGEKCQN